MSGMTFDTGALIALENRTKRIREFADLARTGRIVVTVPAVVLTEWWRGAPTNRSFQTALLDGFVIEPTTARIAKLAGEAIGSCGATPIDAIVMASAALRGDSVLTSDIPDLHRLQDFFPAVRIFHVSLPTTQRKGRKQV